MKNRLIILLLLGSLVSGAQYNSLLWKISGNGLKQPSFLYGTMHTNDARVFSFSDSVMHSFNLTKAYAMELDPKEAFDMNMLSKLVMGKGYSLQKMILPETYKIVDSIVKNQIGVSVSILDNVAPIFIMTLIESAAMNLDESKPADRREVLDLYFYKLAKKKKKKIIGIETVGEQLGALSSLSYQEQADLLTKEVEDLGAATSEGQDVIRFYLEQNLDSLSTYDTDAKLPEKFYKSLVTDRNELMANRTADYIREQSTFIAVGALHLPGSQGVIELLRKKGFTVEAMKK